MQATCGAGRGPLEAQVDTQEAGPGLGACRDPWAALREKFSASTHGTRGLFSKEKFPKPIQTKGLFLL